MGRAITRRKDIDLARVRAAVEQAELITSAEIVVSIAPFFVGDVWRAARRAFTKLGIPNTRDRNGVLIFVVPARRQVVVLADDGAAAHLDPQVWHGVARDVATACGCGDGTAGLVEAIARLGRVLGAPFPRERHDINELPDVVDVADRARAD